MMTIGILIGLAVGALAWIIVTRRKARPETPDAPKVKRPDIGAHERQGDRP